MNVTGIKPKGAYVIVCGNEKGGSGKTTTIVHLSVALMNAGYRVATIDLDSRQKSFTRYLNNRRDWSKRRHLKLPLPDHFVINQSDADYIYDREQAEIAEFSEVIAQVEKSHDFILIDTPGHDGHLMRLAHSMADTLVTPLNDSFIDFDVLGHVSPDTGEILRLSHYAQTVREARRYRNRADNGLLDWVVVRNRLTQLHSRNKEAMLRSLKQLSMELGCRLAEGISERMIFRELFPMGLTALDELDEGSLGRKPSLAVLPARQEVRALIASLRLPIDELGMQRARARRQWLEKAFKPIDTAGILAE
jgi:chromosome partitioning protein